MASVVDICNSALNLIGASNILSLTEDSKAARICNQRYNFVRDATFRSHPWNCLIRRATLSPETDTPNFDFSNQSQLVSFLKNIGLAGGFIFIVANGTKDWAVDKEKKYVRL